LASAIRSTGAFRSKNAAAARVAGQVSRLARPFNARQHVIIDIDTMIFPNARGGTDVQAVNTSSVNLTGSIMLNGNGGIFIAAGLNSVVTVNATFIVSAGTSAGFTTWYRADSSASITGSPNYNIGGSVTGQQFICTNNAGIHLGTPYPPDLSAGSSLSGRQH
jgi:hypothetical protein